MIETIVVGVVILLCIFFAVFADMLFPGSVFADTIDQTIGKFFNFVQFLSNQYVKILESVTIIFFMWILSKLLRFLISVLFKLGQNSTTIGIILNSIIKYASVLVGVFLILSAWGVETPTLLAGAGILGLAISFGAQSLIEDVISGLFIIFEHDFAVGDIIEVDKFRGTVLSIGIRTTKLVDLTGDVKIINNSEIRGAVNTSNNLHPAICDMPIHYEENLAEIEKILRDELPKWKERIPDIIEGPFYKGVQELAPSCVILRIIARVYEEKKYQVNRDMNRELLALIDKHGLDVPYEHLVILQDQTEKKA